MGNNTTSGQKTDPKTEPEVEENTIVIGDENNSGEDNGETPSVETDKLIKEGHPEFELAYDMMLGIRHSLAVANKESPTAHNPSGDATTPSPLNKDDQLFDKKEKYKFPPDGSRQTAPHNMAYFKFRDYMPEVFSQLRDWFEIDPMEYLVSLTSNYNLIEFISNSKSGEFFFYSNDRRFLIKTMPQSESILLRRLMPEYYNYISRQPNTLLTKFFGMHRVTVPSRNKDIYFIIMGSVFNSEKQVHKIYDLKGSTKGRKAKQPDAAHIKTNKVQTLKDIDWEESTDRLNLDPALAMQFKAQLRRDVEFLKKCQIMDYSLLIGIHYINEPRDRANTHNQTWGQNTHSGDAHKYQAKIPADTGHRIPDIKLLRKSDSALKLSNRNNFFTSDEGGMVSHDGSSLYFTGIIDVLQLYNKRKKFEHNFWLVRPSIDVDTVSCVPPEQYGARMLRFIDPKIGPVPGEIHNETSDDLPTGMTSEEYNNIKPKIIRISHAVMDNKQPVFEEDNVGIDAEN